MSGSRLVSINSHKILVAQADLTPLMASLVGVRIPVHSVGRLPVSVLRLHPQHQVLTSSNDC